MAAIAAFETLEPVEKPARLLLYYTEYFL